MPTTNRALWAEKLSDEKLMMILEKIYEMEITGSTDDQDLINYADSYYKAPTRILRLLGVAADARKEAAIRFVEIKNGKRK